ncbi:hypothetical protein [Roseobacter sp. A03A-229]
MLAFSAAPFAVFISDGSRSARLDRFYAALLSELVPTPGPEGDAAMREALSQLTPALQRSDPLRLRLQDFRRTIEDRTDLVRERDSKLAEAAQVGGTGTSTAQRSRAFTEFLQNCTLGEACIGAYLRIVESEEQSVWQYIGERAPPAVLILFLLATLGGLYRYNLRLTGFHHSRADALELFAHLHGDNTSLTSDQITAFAGLADQMAADKVEFGKSGTPSDKAIELARIISQRR